VAENGDRTALEHRVAALDALLPQTQCGRCGYPACRPYAEAVARGAADINRCPPGGDETVTALAALMGVAPRPLDPACGPVPEPAVAVVEERLCIGCTLCLEACPVDAIVGTARRMHTVIAAECTGCALCLPPCPVDCIRLEPVAPPATVQARRAAADRARARFEARTARRARPAPPAGPVLTAAEQLKRDTVARALARARARLGGATGRDA